MDATRERHVIPLNSEEGAFFSKVILPMAYIEGLNGVNRQPSNGPKINRQPSKTEYFYRQPSNEQAKISRQISKIETDWVQVMLLIIDRFNISQRYIFVLVSLE